MSTEKKLDGISNRKSQDYVNRKREYNGTLEKFIAIWDKKKQ